jgi:glucose-1-phosphate thymidylyltransferase
VPLPGFLARATAQKSGGTVFGYQVTDPERYGFVTFDDAGRRAVAITEKPEVPESDYAVTGLYFLDGTAPKRAREVQPSPRGELEITSLLSSYLDGGSLTVERMGRGYAWLDTGTHGSLLDAGNFVRALQDRQGLQISSPEEIAFRHGWIDRDRLLEHVKMYSKTR